MFKYFVSIPIVISFLVLGAASGPLQPGHPAGPDKGKEKKVIAEVGEKAPNFVLKDQHGVTHDLKKYEGSIVVLEWFNDKCPVCNGVWSSGLMPKLIQDLEDLDANVVYLAVNSSADRSKEKVLESGIEFLEEMESDIPMLMDYDGKVGHAYGARTTPHMFIIDVKGILVYEGGLSNDRRMKKGADAETHVLRAVKQMIEGKKVSPSHMQPWGCRVKYAKGDRPNRPKPSRRPISDPRGSGGPR